MAAPNSDLMKKSNILVSVVLVAVVALGAWATTLRQRARQDAPSLPVLSTVPDFSLLDQQGRKVTRASLAGHPFVLNFVFTTCSEFCGDMTDKMAMVRAGLGPSEVRCVSMSVDPAHDTPEALRKFAVAHHANDPRWLFLTGERRTVGVVMQALYLAPSGDPARLNPMQHSSRLVLVDGQGRVRGYYAYDDAEARQRLVADAKALDAEGSR